MQSIVMELALSVYGVHNAGDTNGIVCQYTRAFKKKN